jgi:hypothetical protein
MKAAWETRRLLSLAGRNSEILRNSEVTEFRRGKTLVDFSEID